MGVGGGRGGSGGRGRGGGGRGGDGGGRRRGSGRRGCGDSGRRGVVTSTMGARRTPTPSPTPPSLLPPSPRRPTASPPSPRLTPSPRGRSPSSRRPRALLPRFGPGLQLLGCALLHRPVILLPGQVPHCSTLQTRAVPLWVGLLLQHGTRAITPAARTVTGHPTPSRSLPTTPCNPSAGQSNHTATPVNGRGSDIALPALRRPGFPIDARPRHPTLRSIRGFIRLCRHLAPLPPPARSILGCGARVLASFAR